MGERAKVPLPLHQSDERSGFSRGSRDVVALRATSSRLPIAAIAERHVARNLPAADASGSGGALSPGGRRDRRGLADDRVLGDGLGLPPEAPVQARRLAEKLRVAQLAEGFPAVDETRIQSF